MSITGVLFAAMIVGGTGLFIGVFLGFAGKKFAVEVNEQEEAIMNILPGNNCGGCGYAGCAGLASAIVKGEAELNACPVGGNPVASKIGEIMGKEINETEPMVAFVKCAGTLELAKEKFAYYGVEDCIMMNYVQNGGPKSCEFGCLGYGTCVKACQFDAIHIVDGIALVDKDACKACGKCIELCPRKIIELSPKKPKHKVQCSSTEKGKQVMEVCSIGCIGCKMCQKVCEFDAITIENNLAHINPEKCTNCGACVEKCPKKTII